MRLIKRFILFLAKLLLAGVILSPAIYLFFCFCFVPYHLWTSGGWELPQYRSLEYACFCLGCFVWFFALASLFLLSPLLLAKLFPSLDKDGHKEKPEA